MNIFYTHACPKQAATFLAQDAVRRRKMILESVQLLCTAINLHGGQTPYKSTHMNHPSSIWTRLSRANYYWLLTYTAYLFKLNYKISGKLHKSGLLLGSLYKQRHLLDDRGFTVPPNCAKSKAKNLDFTHLEICQAYKEYLEYQWNM